MCLVGEPRLVSRLSARDRREERQRAAGALPQEPTPERDTHDLGETLREVLGREPERAGLGLERSTQGRRAAELVDEARDPRVRVPRTSGPDHGRSAAQDLGAGKRRAAPQLLGDRGQLTRRDARGQRDRTTTDAAAPRRAVVVGVEQNCEYGSTRAALARESWRRQHDTPSRASVSSLDLDVSVERDIEGRGPHLSAARRGLGGDEDREPFVRVNTEPR